ncbi:MAG: tetratricopeptide repeat protein, partial [Chloroflexi bacterium]|nr:tetratricopeptide repeat protein [Chloroflexota bacterium]
MQLNRSISPSTPASIQPNWRERMALPTIPWPRHLWSIGFIGLWLAVLLGLPTLFAGHMTAGIPETLGVQIASWVTFLAVFITPGWLIAEILTWHLDLDWLERLALAFPLGVAVMAVPGMAALLLHITLAQLNLLWITSSAIVVVAWLIHLVLRRSAPAQSTRWTMDEVILAVLLLAAFVYLLPALNAYKIDGDAYAVATFAADALAGLPLNAREPLFGTDLGPGVRMAFNQSLSMSYLWSYLGHIDPIALTATASRSMVALWIMLSAYALGKTAGISSFGRAHGRRFGLFMAWLQTIIFIAAPFLRGDNVSLFFFERTTADKFMVPMTMLPVGFAFTMRYLADGKKSAWWTAALVAFAVSTIHPLIAAMMALGLAAFAGFHWLMEWRARLVIGRSLAVAGLVAIVMVLPIVQLVLSRGEEPLAPSYPTSLENWPIGYRREPILPFWNVPSMTVIGPLPDLVQLQASDANTVTNPFLIWRFAVNMDRRRLILFDLNHYISDPNLFLEPPYLLALLLLPFLLRKLRMNLAAQFAVSTTLAILFVMFNPWLTPLIGSLVMPWILWRFVWLLPYALIIALVLYRLLSWFVGWVRERVLPKPIRGARWASLAFVVIVSLVVSPVIGQNLQELNNRSAFPYFFPAPTKIFARLQTLTLHTPSKIVMADQDISVTLPAYVANANVVAHRMPTTSEIFPATQQDEALQRLIDQAKFYRARYLTVETVNILKRYQTGYIIATGGSDLDIQLRSAPEWFTWVMNDQSYSLYAVQKQPEVTDVVNGNTALVDRQWALAENFYRTELTHNPKSAMALLGLAEIAHVKGRFTNAIALLNQAVAQADQPFFHYRLGQIYAEMGQAQPSIGEFTKAQTAAPDIARFNLALGDACLAAEQNDCAATQFAAAVANGNSPDEESRQVALADLWRQRGQTARSIPLYEQAVARKPGIDNQLMLASVYQEAGRYTEAETLLNQVQAKHPLSSEALALAAVVKAKQTKTSEATALYQRAIWLQDIQGWDSLENHLALAQSLLDVKQTDPARTEIEHVLAIDPNNALAYDLQGTLDLQQNQLAAATQAYQQSFRLDPSRVGTYIALSSQLREEGGQQAEMTALLQRAIKASPDEAILAMALGDQLERQGDTQAAIDAYHSALDLLEEESLPNKFNIRSQEISRAYAYTRLAGVSEEIGQIEPATNYYAAAVAAVPDLAWPQLLLGDASLRQGDMTAAETAYTRAITNDASAVESYLRLVDLYEARGDQAKAEAVQQRALQVALANSAKIAPVA